MANAFEELCKIASDQQWCWDLLCTTCGRQDLTYGLYQIARGIEPRGEKWIEPRDWRDADRRFAANLDEVRRGLRFRHESLYLLCASASVQKLAESCRFPDHLGYMGVVLNDLEKVEKRFRLLTRLWGNELLDLVGRGSEAHVLLTRLVSSPDEQLCWQDLELVERASIGRDPH